MAPQSTDKDSVGSPGGTCPNCKKPSLPSSDANAPFCSHRCALVDLGRWFKGDYRIPAEGVPDSAEAGEEI